MNKIKKIVALAAIAGLSLGAAYSQNASANAVETYRVQRSILYRVMIQKWINEKVKNNAGFADWFANGTVSIDENGRFPFVLISGFSTDGEKAFYKAFYSDCFVDEKGGPMPRSAADVADFKAKRYGYKKEYWAAVDAVVLTLTAQERNLYGELITFKNVNFGDSPVRITGRDPYSFDTDVKSTITPQTKAAIKKKLAKIEQEEEKQRQEEEERQKKFRETDYCDDKNSPLTDFGTVSFKSEKTWKIGDQEWSDVVTATACQKETFTGKSDVAYYSDCICNRCKENSGDFFSWCAVKRYGEKLCPAPWRVPTKEDFVNLNKAMGGNGSYRSIRSRLYFDTWGASLGGFYEGNRTDYCGFTFYWSQSKESDYSGRESDDYGYCLMTDNNYNTQTSKRNGLMLRCVKQAETKVDE